MRGVVAGRRGRFGSGGPAGRGAARRLRRPCPTSATSVACTAALGLPLVEIAASPTGRAPLASAPVSPKDVEVLGASGAAAILVREGAFLVIDAPRPEDHEDVASYLDLAAFDLLDVVPLGSTIEPALPAPSEVDGRVLFGQPAPSAELASFVAALRKASDARQPAGVGALFSAKAGALLAPAALLTALAGFVVAVSRLLGRLAAEAAARVTTSAPRTSNRALAAVPSGPAGPSFADQLAHRMRDWLARALIRLRLAQIIGRHQAAYLGRVLDMFERGDLASALRHAIPLGGDGALGPSFGTPTPRNALGIVPFAAGASSSISVGADFQTLLRRTYRAAFERLEREGRIDEAAFVLAELLRANEEAVSFLSAMGGSSSRRRSPKRAGCPPAWSCVSGFSPAT